MTNTACNIYFHGEGHGSAPAFANCHNKSILQPSRGLTLGKLVSMLGFIKVELKGGGHQQKRLKFIATLSSYCFTFIRSMMPQKSRKLTKHEFFIFSGPINFMILKLKTHTNTEEFWNVIYSKIWQHLGWTCSITDCLFTPLSGLVLLLPLNTL